MRLFLDHQLRGLFATRYPCRPNPIGLSIVRLVSIMDNTLEIEGMDVLDGTPLLDIKPYVPDLSGTFVIGATCAWCLASAAIMTALLWRSLPPGKAALSKLRSGEEYTYAK